MKKTKKTPDNKPKSELELYSEAFLDKVYSIKKNAEAQSRDAYINQIEYIVGGAAGEFYKCRIHDKLKAAHPDRQHWENEWRSLLGRILHQQFIRSVKSKPNLDGRLKAFDQAMNDYETTDRNRRVFAANTIAKYLGASSIKFQKVLEEKDAADFLSEVRTALRFIIDNYDNPAAFKKKPENRWNEPPKKQKKPKHPKDDSTAEQTEPKAQENSKVPVPNKPETK